MAFEEEATAFNYDNDLWELIEEQERVEMDHRMRFLQENEAVHIVRFQCGCCRQEKTLNRFVSEERAEKVLVDLATAAEDARKSFDKKFVRYGHFTIRLLNMVDTHLVRRHERCKCEECKIRRKKEDRYQLIAPWNICSICDTWAQEVIDSYYETFYPPHLAKEPVELDD